MNQPRLYLFKAISGIRVVILTAGRSDQAWKRLARIECSGDLDRAKANYDLYRSRAIADNPKATFSGNDLIALMG